MKKYQAEFPQNFLWGGAIAANQAEGTYLTDGKGEDLSDIWQHGIQGGADRPTLPNVTIPTVKRLIFIIVTRRTLLILKKWDLTVFARRSTGREFFQMVMMRHQMRLV